MSHSPAPTPNGYQHRISPCSSPGMMPGGKPLHRGSPAPMPPSPAPPGSLALNSSSQQLRPNPSLRIVGPAGMRGDHPNDVCVHICALFTEFAHNIIIYGIDFQGAQGSALKLLCYRICSSFHRHHYASERVKTIIVTKWIVIQFFFFFVLDVQTFCS